MDTRCLMIWKRKRILAIQR